jgi:hypothetical protein
MVSCAEKLISHILVLVSVFVRIPVPVEKSKEHPTEGAFLYLSRLVMKPREPLSKTVSYETISCLVIA